MAAVHIPELQVPVSATTRAKVRRQGLLVALHRVSLLAVAGVPSYVVAASMIGPHTSSVRLRIWLTTCVIASGACGFLALTFWKHLPRFTNRAMLRSLGLIFGLPLVAQWGIVSSVINTSSEHVALIVAVAVLVASIGVFAACGAAGGRLTVAMMAGILLPNYVVFVATFGAWSLPAMLIVYGSALALAAGAVAHNELKSRELLIAHSEQLLERVSQERASLTELNAELEYRATHDRLMGIPNRDFLQTELQAALSRSQRGRPESRIGLLFLDLDRFKFVNDTLGHSAGDALLVMVGARIESALANENAVLARVGGDELVVLMRCLESDDHLGLVADKLLAKFVNPFTIEGVELSIGTSIGVAESIVGESADDLYRHADAALYEAKQRGRGRSVVADDELRSRRNSRVRTELALRTALSRHEIEAWFQPEVDLVSGRIVAAEALARWRIGDEVALASSFIDVARQAGLLEPLMFEMLDQVWDWQATHGHRIPISVNVSATHLPALLDAHRTLPAARPLANLRLEISEDDLLRDLEETRSVLEQVRELGARIILDDFGSGASSFLVLSDLPIDAIKIDRSYVQRVERDERVKTLVTSLAEFGRSCKIEIIAEGVETEAQADFLMRIGIDRAQGMLFSAAVDPIRFEALSATGYVGAELVGQF